MAYNSDGYIMIDFAEVDFSKTNQTIDGLFDRCQKVIGTNKFVIVINANNKTPLPSTVCITNGQYVIESVLFTFSISSADNLHITKKTTPEELIDDNHITLKTTWSSNKIDRELNTKQNILTAGDNITINNGVISADGVKSFTYTGTSGATHTIEFPTKPKYILGISGEHTGLSTYGIMQFFAYGDSFAMVSECATNSTSNPTFRMASLSYNDKEITITASSTQLALNRIGAVYTVYYI